MPTTLLIILAVLISIVVLANMAVMSLVTGEPIAAQSLTIALALTAVELSPAIIILIFF